MGQKKALIAVNYIGFLHFLWDDIDLLNRRGYKVYAIGDNRKNETHTLEILMQKNVSFIDARMDSKNPLTKTNMAYYRQVRQLLKEHHFDLIHCHTPIVGLLVRLAARSCRKQGAKVIYTTHGLAYTHLSSKKEYLIYHSIESLASRFTDAIITINYEDYNNAKKLHCRRVYHINGVGVDIQRYHDVVIDRDKYRAQNGIPNDKLLILSVGELSQRKNHVIIVDALAQLENKSNYVFGICGRSMTGKGTQEVIQKRAEEQGVNVMFLGFRKDIPQLVHCADIGAIPSIREGLGLAGVQTLCAGVPLVGSDVQGIREYVIDGKTGFLCNPYDASSFAKAIEKLSNKECRDSMRDSCMEVVKKFDKSISITQRKTIYDEIIGS